MAPKTGKKLIKGALANLSKDNFEKFRDELLDREGEPRVDRNQVEGANYIVVADVLDLTFEAGAPAVVVELLREIRCHRDATKLEREIGEQSSNPGSSDTVSPSAGAEAGCTEEHFVDKHSDELIDRVSNIDSILDELATKKFITHGAYKTLLANPDPIDRVRKLLSGPLHSAGSDGKDAFYEILEKQQKHLVADLKKNK